MPVWPSRPAVQIPGIACRIFNIRGQEATNRIDTLAQRFRRIHRVSGRMEAPSMRCNCNSLAIAFSSWPAVTETMRLGKKSPRAGSQDSQMRTLKFSTSGLHCCQLAGRACCPDGFLGAVGILPGIIFSASAIVARSLSIGKGRGCQVGYNESIPRFDTQHFCPVLRGHNPCGARYGVVTLNEIWPILMLV